MNEILTHPAPLITLGVVFLLVLVWRLVRPMLPQFGGPLSKSLQDRYAQSRQWKQGKFENEIPAKMTPAKEPLKMFKEMRRFREVRKPKKPLPILPFDAKAWEHTSEPAFIWYGHGVLLLKVAGKTLLIDPMFGPNAAPISPFGVSRFSQNTLDIIDTLPALDAILLTHDHYDHLDLASIERLHGRTQNWWVALGVGRHLEHWGIPSQQIREFDWWDEHSLDGLDIIFTPARHFSGRGLRDRGKSLWGGWVFKTDQHRLYWTGDGGYGDHFKEVGHRFGPFDFGWIECGQYNWRWHDIHMLPPESASAVRDAKIQVAMPMHWGSFSLAFHPWTEPADRFVEEVQKLGIPYCTPKLGEMVALGGPYPTSPWWDTYKLPTP